MDDNYALLGLPCDANLPDIKKAYRNLVAMLAHDTKSDLMLMTFQALKWHPDRYPKDGDKGHAVSMFAKITTAYQTLLRDHKLASLTYGVKSKVQTRLPTPMPSYKSFSEDSSTSASHSNAQFSFNSHRDSQSTLPSSPDDTFQARDCLTNGGQSLHSIQFNHDQASTPSPNSSTGHRERPGESERYPSPPRPLPEWVTRNLPPGENGPRNNLPPTLVAIPVLHKNENPSRVTPLCTPLQTLGVGRYGEWAYPLTLTLEELFSGKHCRFCIARRLLSGRTKNVIIEIDVPSGCRHGTRILCRGVGHELSNGILQDVAFVVEEAPHIRFSRIEDDLYLDLRLPWTDNLTHRPERISIRGIDGKDIVFFIDYLQHKMLRGELCVKGAGMPARDRGRVVGRSDLVIRWEIQSPPTRVWKFLDRFLHPKSKCPRKA